MKKCRIKFFVIFLALLTIAAAVFHLAFREENKDGTLRVKTGGQVIILDTSEFLYEKVTGVRVNGKGETISVNAPGVSLKRVLKEFGISEYSAVKVNSDDSYSAELSREEIEDGTKAFLIWEDEKELRLVVFGDTNSKRSVSDVAEIVVE